MFVFDISIRSDLILCLSLYCVCSKRHRNATVRVPSDGKSAVLIAKLVPEKFSLWDNFRNRLLIKAAPLIQMLPKQELGEIIEILQVKEYSTGDHALDK